MIKQDNPFECFTHPKETIFPNLFKALIFKIKHYTGFSIRASSWQNSPAISCELAAYFSLEITPQKAKI